MYALANASCSVLRGTTTNAYGDEVDSATVVASGVLAAIREVASASYDASTQTRRVVRKLQAQVQSDVDLRVEDRLRDDTHGVTYMIENVTSPQGVGHAPDKQVELKKLG